MKTAIKNHKSSVDKPSEQGQDRTKPRDTICKSVENITSKIHYDVLHWSADI